MRQRRLDDHVEPPHLTHTVDQRLTDPGPRDTFTLTVDWGGGVIAGQPDEGVSTFALGPIPTLVNP